MFYGRKNCVQLEAGLFSLENQWYVYAKKIKRAKLATTCRKKNGGCDQIRSRSIGIWQKRKYGGAHVMCSIPNSRASVELELGLRPSPARLRNSCLKGQPRSMR